MCDGLCVGCFDGYMCGLLSWLHVWAVVMVACVGCFDGYVTCVGCFDG